MAFTVTALGWALTASATAQVLALDPGAAAQLKADFAAMHYNLSMLFLLPNFLFLASVGASG